MDEPAVWSELGHAQLEAKLVADAIASYLKSSDSSKHLDVITKSKDSDCYDVLVEYLLMVRKKVKDAKVDTELVYAYAKTKQLGPLEEFITTPNQANLQSVGDRLFDEGLYEVRAAL